MDHDYLWMMRSKVFRKPHKSKNYLDEINGSDHRFDQTPGSPPHGFDQIGNELVEPGQTSRTSLNGLNLSRSERSEVDLSEPFWPEILVRTYPCLTPVEPSRLNPSRNVHVIIFRGGEMSAGQDSEGLKCNLEVDLTIDLQSDSIEDINIAGFYHVLVCLMR